MCKLSDLPAISTQLYVAAAIFVLYLAVIFGYFLPKIWKRINH